MRAAIETIPVTDVKTDTASRKMIWAGRVVSTLPILFLLMDAIVKFIKPEGAVELSAQLGWREHLLIPIGVVLLVCTILYAIPRTAFLGAILLTGYLGGAVATHVRVGSEPFSVVFPIIVGSFIWLGLYLRDERLRALIPFGTGKEQGLRMNDLDTNI